MFFRSRKQKGPESPKLGFRSAFVLAKLGHDMRAHYTDVLDASLPEEIERPLERLRGPGSAVEQLDDRRRR